MSAAWLTARAPEVEYNGVVLAAPPAGGHHLQHGQRGDCWDSAVVESFATLKRELLARHRWPTREAASAAIADYRDGWYNLHRRHPALGNVSPIAYEARQ